MNIWYYGVADANGIESFHEDYDPMVADAFIDDKELKSNKAHKFSLALRAVANAQRHAVAYRVLLDAKLGDEINQMLKDGKAIEGLKMLKNNAQDLLFAVQGTTLKAAKKNWALIPNTDLDPYN